MKIENIPTPQKTVLLALSGGVDSAVCARLLQQQGYSVHALFILFSPAHQKAQAAAQRAAEELGVPFYTADVRQRFEELVIAPFCSDYVQGRTPNPCVVCNPLVKFYTLTQQADALSIPYIATGHYARLQQENGIYYVTQAKSAERDQSYMLYRLGQPVLRRLLLPAGSLEKDAIRAKAQGEGLSSAHAPDSQEICFIEDGNYADWMQQRGVTGKAGNFIAPNGTPLAAHGGTHRYTVGQRRHLGVSLGRPAFVKAILPSGDIQLAFEDSTNAAAVLLEDVVFTTGQPFDENAAYTVKIRSMAKPAPCRVRQSGKTWQVLFDVPLRSPAPGQHAVLYRGQRIEGGGVITGTL